MRTKQPGFIGSLPNPRWPTTHNYPKETTLLHGRAADWTRTLNNLASLNLPVEDARDIFESIHGFRPDTGKPTPRRQRWFEHFLRFMGYWRLP